MFNNYKRNIFLIILILLIFAFIESAIRIFGKFDEDGNFFFLSTPLKPYRMPLSNMKRVTKDYYSNSDSCIAYDPFCGWSFRPKSHSIDKMYIYNEYGFRDINLYYKPPDPNTITIAIFGDSFSEGSEVPYKNTWGYYLEKALSKKGFKVKVLNFGVGNYGMDQAFLRWIKMGARFSPDIVIFGFFAEDMDRNISMFYRLDKEYYWPLSKPRFIFNNNGQLKLINSPCQSPKNKIKILESIANWDLSSYEAFYDPKYYKERFFYKSRFLCLLLASFKKLKILMLPLHERFFPLKEHYSPNTERTKLAAKIIEEFRKNVTKDKKTFLIVHLPGYNDLSRYLKTGGVGYEHLLGVLEKSSPIIHPEFMMLKEMKASSFMSLFARNHPNTHYSAKGNKIVADVLMGYFCKHKYLLKKR